MSADNPALTPSDDNKPWYKLLNRYHWYVLIVAALGWLFDAMDQQLFVLAASPALSDLTGLNIKDVGEYRGLATTIFIMGWATGGLIFGFFGDRFGRARTMIITILIYSLFTGLSGLSQSFTDFAIYRFLAGIGVGGEFAAGVALVAEVMPSKARPYALGFLQALSAVGNAAAAGINLLFPADKEMTFFNLEGFQGWRLLFFVGVLPAILVIFIRRGLKEPDLWKQAKETKKDDFHRQMGDLREMFGTPRWRYNIIVGVWMGMIGVMGLWGVGLWARELITNIVVKDPAIANNYLSYGFMIGNIGTFFGVYSFSWITGKIGRRWAFALAYSLAMIANILFFGFLTDKSQVLWAMPLLFFCIFMVFGGFAVYFPELFPTRLRATGTGFCYNVARYLAAVAPLVLGLLISMYSAPADTLRGEEKLSSLTILSSLGSTDHALRYAAITVTMVYIFGLLIVPFIPETKDQPLPE